MAIYWVTSLAGNLSKISKDIGLLEITETPAFTQTPNNLHRAPA